MIITAATPDEFYFNQLLTMLTSMRMNSSRHTATVFLVNYPTDKSERLKEVFSDFEFQNRKVEMIDKRGISLILLRIQLVLECFERHNVSVSWIDTDVVVRGSIEPFIRVQPNQFKILHRGDSNPEKVRFNAGIFSIGCSPATKKMVQDWRVRLQADPIWGKGQLYLYKAFKVSRGIDLVKMPSGFNDLGDSRSNGSFREGSLIWHCKKQHFNNVRFQKEFQHYLAKGKEVYYG